MPGFAHLNRLAHADNTAGASAQVSTAVFDAFDFLLVHVYIEGYSATSTARLQFNGDTGTTAYAYTVAENAAAVTTGVAGAAAGIAVATTNQVARALTSFWIRNISNKVKGVWGFGSTNSIAAATAPAFVQIAGIWVNTTAQITRITLDVGPGGGTMNAGTALDVYGMTA